MKFCNKKITRSKRNIFIENQIKIKMSTPLNKSPTPAHGTHNAKESKREEIETLIITINNKDEFERYIKSTENKYILVYFYATWCAPCKKLSEKFKELAEKYQDKLIVLKLNIDDLEEIAVEYDVTVMPSFTVVKEGKKLEHYFGNKLEQVDKLAEKYLANTS